MLDVGANTGYYGLLAAKLGHSVIQFDLQPTCLKILRNSVIANGFADRVITVASGVSDSYANISVPDEGCDGRFPASAHERKSFGKFQRTTPLRPLDAFLANQDDKTIILMKVDTEGNEKRVLDGSRDYFKTRRILNAIVEVTPSKKFWENNGITKEEVVQTLQEIIDFGYWIISLHDGTVHRSKESVAKYMERPTFLQTDFVLTVDEDFRALIGDRDTLDLGLLTV
jgi:FkbM family methyltransferase